MNYELFAVRHSNCEREDYLTGINQERKGGEGVFGVP
jgi:hypothetical protein